MSAVSRLAQEIAQSGQRHAFGIPGGGQSLSLIDELESCGIEFHVTHTEASAALMAGTVGRLKGRAGIAVGIKGPGLANMIPGLAVCHLERFPVVALVESYAQGTDWRFRHKGLDHGALTAALVKGYGALGSEGTFDRYAALAESEAPGPVVVDLVEGEVGPIASTQLTETDRGRVLDALLATQKPVVIAGTFSERANWDKNLSELSVPVFTTTAAKGVIDESLPYAAGVYTGAGLEGTPESRILSNADLIVGLGLRASEVLVARPFDTPSVNIDSIPADPPFEFVATTTPETAGAVFDALQEHTWGLDEVSEARQALAAQFLNGEFLPAHAFKTVERHFNREVRLVLDTGNFCTVAEHIWPARHSRLCLLSGQGRYMGTAVPMAVAAALDDPNTPTVAVLGDGGIGMYLADVRLAVRHRLPLLFVLMTDGGFGSIRARAQREGLTVSPLTIDDPSWLPTFESLGFPATRAESEQALADALADWTPSEGPAYIEMPFEPDAYGAMLNGIR